MSFCGPVYMYYIFFYLGESNVTVVAETPIYEIYIPVQFCTDAMQHDTIALYRNYIMKSIRRDSKLTLSLY